MQVAGCAATGHKKVQYLDDSGTQVSGIQIITVLHFEHLSES